MSKQTTTGPAYVRTVALGMLFVPTCMAHERPWVGPSTQDHALAASNAGLHNTDVHGRDQGGLW